MNPYDALQVSPAADALVIRAAYRSLIQRHHPDRNPGDAQAAQQAVLVTQAYELLANPQRRAAYDAQSLAERAALLNAPKPKTWPHPSNRQSNTANTAKPPGFVWSLRVQRCWFFCLWAGLSGNFCWPALNRYHLKGN